MPALPPAAKVIRFEMHFSIGQDLAAKCRFYDQYTATAPTNGDLNALAEEVSDQYDTNLKGLATPAVSLTQVVITDLSSATSAIGSDTTTVVGTNGGGALPADVCTLQSRKVARRYRGGHCRIYFPFGSQANLQDEQTWSAAYVAAATTDIAAFSTGIHAAVWAGGGTLAAVNVSFYAGFTVHTGTTGRARNVSTPRATALIDPVVDTKIQQGIAVQRKRLLRLA